MSVAASYADEEKEAVCFFCRALYPMSEFTADITKYACSNSVFPPLLCNGKIVLRAKNANDDGTTTSEYHGPIDCSIARAATLRAKNTFQNPFDFDIYCLKCKCQYGYDHDLPANFLEIPCKMVNFNLPESQRVPCGGKWVAIPRNKSKEK